MTNFLLQDITIKIKGYAEWSMVRVQHVDKGMLDKCILKVWTLYFAGPIVFWTFVFFYLSVKYAFQIC